MKKNYLIVAIGAILFFNSGCNKKSIEDDQTNNITSSYKTADIQTLSDKLLKNKNFKTFMDARRGLEQGIMENRYNISHELIEKIKLYRRTHQTAKINELAKGFTEAGMENAYEYLFYTGITIRYAGKLMRQHPELKDLSGKQKNSLFSETYVKLNSRKEPDLRTMLTARKENTKLWKTKHMNDNK